MGLKWKKESEESRLPYGLYLREEHSNWRLSDFVFEGVLEEELHRGIRPGWPLKVAILGSLPPVSSVIEGFRHEIAEQALDFSIVNTEEEADIILRLETDRYYLTWPHDSKPLTEIFNPEPTNGKFFYEHFLTTLAHISQWKKFRDAHSPESEEERVKFRIYQLHPNDPEQQVLEEHEAVLNMTHDLNTQTPRTHLRLEIENTTDQPLYYKVYHVSVMFAINARGIFDYEGGYIAAGGVESTTIPQRPSKQAAQSTSQGQQYRYLAFDLPEHIRDWNWATYESQLIILTSPEPFEVHGLEQDYLKPPQAEPNPRPEGANKEKYVFPEFAKQIQLQSYKLTFLNPLAQPEQKKEVESFEPVDYEVVEFIGKPVCLMATDAETEIPQAFIEQKAEEVHEALEGMLNEDWLELAYLPTDPEGILAQLQEIGQRVQIFHTILANTSPFPEQNLAQIENFLPLIPNVKVLFVHGEADAAIIEKISEFQQAPSFIITLKPNIEDWIDRGFIRRFYERLTGFSPERAFEEASQQMEFEIFGQKRVPLGFENFDREKDELPWKLYINDPAQGAWNLLAAAGKSLLGIPQVPGEFSFPEYPFPGLKPYTNRHAFLYYGRDNYINLLYQLFEDPNAPSVILLSGRSGVGKSSLLDAGVMPRLQEGNQDFLYLRPTDGPPLDQLMMESLRAYPGAGESSDLLSAWKAAEQAGGILHLIVDPEIASVSLDPGEDPYGLGALFHNKDDRPQGKLLLCYRDDQHDSMADAMHRLRWKSAHIRLQRPDRQVIMDILTGYEQNTSAQKEWGISFEENLKDIIADNLVVIADQPILPTFQILMKPWWEDKRRSKSGRANFGHEEYTQKRVEGYSLEQHVDQQLEAIARYNDNKYIDVKSIALDLLNMHIAEDEALLKKELWEFHRRHDKTKEPDVLRRQLIERGLLREAGDKTSLTHEVLAKIVRKMSSDVS